MRVSTGERVTQAEFARRVGNSRAAVCQATKRGRITAEADGRYDLQRPENATYLSTSKRQRRQAHRGSGGKPAGSAPKHQTPADPPPESRRHHGAAPGTGGSATETWDEADRRKKVADANKVELAVARERKELVPRADVESIFNKLIAVLTQQTLAIPQRASPTLCGELGVDDADKVIRCQAFLDREIRTGVELQKQLMLDYIREMEE